MSYNDLKQALDEYDWDDGFELPRKILDNEHCDLALALEIFYLADGFAYLDSSAKDTGLKEWKQFIDTLYKDILCGRYCRTDNMYEIPLTKVQKYKFRKKSVPEIFLLDL